MGKVDYKMRAGAVRKFRFCATACSPQLRDRDGELCTVVRCDAGDSPGCVVGFFDGYTASVPEHTLRATAAELNEIREALGHLAEKYGLGIAECLAYFAAGEGNPYVVAAVDEYADSPVEVDAGSAVLREGDSDGVWVSAWVWVSHEMAGT